MTKSEKLKSEILSQYKSIHQFATEMNIPYSTLSSALNGKVDGMAYGTVLKICEQLKLNPINFNRLSKSNKSNQVICDSQINYFYNKLNKKGQDTLCEILKDMTSLKKYTDRN